MVLYLFVGVGNRIISGFQAGIGAGIFSFTTTNQAGAWWLVIFTLPLCVMTITLHKGWVLLPKFLFSTP
jgi:hypothetical protein